MKWKKVQGNNSKLGTEKHVQWEKHKRKGKWVYFYRLSEIRKLFLKK